MKKYQIENSIGNGNFSTVYHAKQLTTHRPCAIKVMKTHKKIALREATLLKKFKHPNVIALLDFQQNQHQSWIVLEQAGINTLELYQNHKNGLREEQVKCILFQAALGLSYVHSFGVIHRDVKPQNLLIDKKTASVKLIDFGLAIQQLGVSTDYIATRWYRAPENLLGTKQYTCAIDVFSLGCVIVELYLGSPLFPGANNLDQIIKIFNILGYPSPDSWQTGYNKMIELGLKPIKNTRQKQMDLKEILHPCDTRLIDLLISMLALNPKNRISCAQIVRHQYFKDIRSIIPPFVYSRYEQDFVGKKQLNFKGVGQQKHPRLNLNTKYFVPQINGGNVGFHSGNQKSKLHMHKSIEHQFSNQNMVLRTKKSTSTDSIKSYYSHQQSLILMAKQQKKLAENRKKNEDNKNDEQFKQKEGTQELPQSLSNQQSQQDVRGSKQKTSFDPCLQEIKKSQTSAGDSSKNHQNIIIPNVPTVKTQLFGQNRRYSTITNESEINNSYRSPPSILHSQQYQPSNNSQYLPILQSMNKFSIPPQINSKPCFQRSRNDQSIDNKSLQRDQNFTRFQSKINPSARRNRVNQVNISGNQDNSFRMPFSPQHQFQGLNLYRNIHHPNPRRPQEATPRLYCSPSIQNFQSPPPFPRKNTVVSPPHYRLQANSPQNFNFLRTQMHNPRQQTKYSPRNTAVGFIPQNHRLVKM